MKTYDTHDESGQLTGFEVSNAFLTRRAVSRIVRSIPGAHIVRERAPFSSAAPDDFCEFTVGEKAFRVIEPFGDNSRYWLASVPPEESEELFRIRTTFLKRRLFFGLFSG